MSEISICIPTNRSAADMYSMLDSLNISALKSNSSLDVLIAYNGINPINSLDRDSFQNLNLRILKSRTNSLSAARNTCLLNSASDWIAFLDDDVKCSIGYVSELLAAIKHTRANIAIAGRITLEDQHKLPENSGHVWKTLLCDFDFGDKKFPLNGPGVGANFVVNREFAIEVGGFNESLGRTGSLLLSNEDTDFFIRHLKNGGHIEYNGKLQIFHNFHDSRSDHRWMIERMVWQGISDVAMGERVTSETLRESINRTNIPELSSGIEKLLSPPMGISEFEARLNAIRLLQKALCSYSSFSPPKSHEPLKNKGTNQRLLDSKVIFIEFSNNHPGNFEYVYSQFQNSYLIKTSANPWNNPIETINVLHELLDITTIRDKVIVFLSADSIFWNHLIFKEKIELLSKHNQLIAFIHRTNREIEKGVNRLGDYFSEFVMYGFHGPKLLSARWNIAINSSPIPSFIESNFEFLLTEKKVNQPKYTFGLVGEFRAEKNYAYFLDCLRGNLRDFESVLLAGRDLDHSRTILAEKLKPIVPNLELLTDNQLKNLNFDRNFLKCLDQIEIFVSGYSGQNEISASGPIAEALVLGKKILIDDKTWIYQDLVKYSPNQIYRKDQSEIEETSSRLSELVSSQGALNCLNALVNKYA